jgi:formylmethanofuran dehydrogenase subunit E
MSQGDDVFGNEDLRRYVFAFLRKTPQKTCHVCGDVCVWDTTVKYDDRTYCMACWGTQFYGMGCRMV